LPLKGNKEGTGLSHVAKNIIIDEDKKDSISHRLGGMLGYEKLKDNQIKYLDESFGWRARLTNEAPLSPGVPDMHTMFKKTDEKLIVVEDVLEWNASFENILYCSLDYQILQLMILYFTCFQIWLDGNSLLALFWVYILEQAFLWYRQSRGTANLCKKTYTDERFLS